MTEVKLVTRRDLTMSGDYYTGSPAAWDRYHEAWRRSDMETVHHMEEGSHEDFWYDPD